jgi:phosphoribosyl 1,2-cyclic phosphate phosphodiesterase
MVLRFDPMPEFAFTFLGTGTSTGVPMIGCKCEVCTSPDPRDKRTRSSIWVRTPELAVVVDTGPDFRAQCLREGIDSLDAVLYTHGHTDHMMGFDDLRRFSAMLPGKFPVYGTQVTLATLRQCFAFAFEVAEPPPFYLRPEAREVSGPFTLGGTLVTPVDLPHGPHYRTTGYVFSRAGRKLLAYYNDCSEVPPEAREAAEGCEVLVLDALRPKPHPTHMTIEQALEVAAAIRPSQCTYFTHMSDSVLHAETQATLPEGVFLAYDGLRHEF